MAIRIKCKSEYHDKPNCPIIGICYLTCSHKDKSILVLLLNSLSALAKDSQHDWVLLFYRNHDKPNCPIIGICYWTFHQHQGGFCLLEKSGDKNLENSYRVLCHHHNLFRIQSPVCRHFECDTKFINVHRRMVLQLFFLRHQLWCHRHHIQFSHPCMHEVHLHCTLG